MWAEAHSLLTEKRHELAIEIGRVSAPPESTGDISFGKRVGDGTSIAVERYANVAVHDRLISMLADIDRALAKIEDRTYGSCDRCGEDIPESRLDALPWATTCVTCVR